MIAPGLFVMQAIGRLGNFFNQELYGPPTNLPWGIAIDCAHRLRSTRARSTPRRRPGFHPLFLYESISGAIGAVTLLWIARRWGSRMRPGDLVLIFFIWYAAVRFALETLRIDNWTFFGIPTAMVVSVAVIVVSLLLLAWRHRPGAVYERWGDPPPPEEELLDDEEWIEDDEAEPAARPTSGDRRGHVQMTTPARTTRPPPTTTRGAGTGDGSEGDEDAGHGDGDDGAGPGTGAGDGRGGATA